MDTSARATRSIPRSILAHPIVRRGFAVLALGGTAALGLFVADVVRKSRNWQQWSMLRLFSPTDAIRSIGAGLLSPHMRNLILVSAACSFAARTVMARYGVEVSWTRTFWLFFALAWTLWYHTNIVERPVFHFERTVGNLLILERMRVRLFRPAFWATNAHLQTVLLNSLNKLDEWLHPYAGYRRQTLAAFDGNWVNLDWASGPLVEALPDDAPVCLLFHGIAGTASDNYLRNVVHLCTERGWRAVVHDRWRLDYAETRDVDVAVAAIRARYPRARIAAVAFSAGAHVLLTYLARGGASVPLMGAAVVSPALDLVKQIAYMERSPTLAYLRVAMEAALSACVRRHASNDRHCSQSDTEDLLRRFAGCHKLYDDFLASLPTFAGKGEAVPLPPRTPAAPAAAGGGGSGGLAAAAPDALIDPDSLLPLPEAAYSPFGNETGAHYRLTAANNLHRIQIPTLVLLARDDPLLPPSFGKMLERATRENPSLLLATTERGGHCAWHEGPLYPAGASYAEQLVMDYLGALVSAQASAEYMVDVVGRVYNLARPHRAVLDHARLRAHHALLSKAPSAAFDADEPGSGAADDDDQEQARSAVFSHIVSTSNVRLSIAPSASQSGGEWA